MHRALLMAFAIALFGAPGCASSQPPPPPEDPEACLQQCRGAAQAKIDCYCKDQLAETIEGCEVDDVSEPGCLGELRRSWDRCAETCAPGVQ